MTTNVAVIGARGRMGSTVCSAVEAADDLDLVAEIDLGDDVDAVARADVAVVFSVPAVALDHVLTCVRHRVHTVVGTTGWTVERLDAVREAVTAEDVRALAAELAGRPRSLAVVGPFDEDRTFPGAGL